MLPLGLQEREIAKEVSFRDSKSIFPGSCVMDRRLLIGAIVVVWFLVSQVSLAAGSQEPGYASKVIVTGAEREKIKSMPITARPYRPLHFYGNTVRRMHYRGTPLPSMPGR